MTDREMGRSINNVLAAVERLSLRGYADWVLGIGCINELNAIRKEIEQRAARLGKTGKEGNDGNANPES